MNNTKYENSKEQLKKYGDRLGELVQKRTQELKNANEQLKESEERYHQLVELSPDPIIVQSEGKIVFINTAGANLLGTSKKELTGTPAIEIIHPDHRKIVKERIQHMQDTAGSVPLLEEKFVRSDGTIIDVEVTATQLTFQGKPATLAVVRDITERKKMLQVLERERQRLFLIFDELPAILYLQAKDHSIQFANRYYKQHFGEPGEKKCYESLMGLDEPCQRCQMESIFKKKTPINYEFIDSKGRTFDMHYYPFYDTDGSSLILTMGIDITERKRFENEMSRLERLNLVGQMAAGIAHEIKNPITTMRGFVQMLSKKKECSKFKEHYNLMLDELDRVNALVNDFLSMARNKPVDLKEQNLNSIIQALYPLIQADAGNNEQSVILELEDIPSLPLSEKEIRQLILNIARNGLEAMPPGGCLTIKTFVDGKDIILAVQDEGSGIEPEVLDKISTPFFTTKENGTGLGLAVCHNIAETHNAYITAETNTIGTTFFVRFRH